MKGLLLKELYTIKNNYKAYIVFLAFYLLTFFMRDWELIMIWSFAICMTCCAVPIRFCVEDEKSGWSRYVGVLPYSKAQIVSARYIISTVLQLVILLLFAISQAVCMNLNGGFSLGEYLIYLSMLFFISCAVYGCYPMRIHFGSSGIIAVFALIVWIIAISYVVISNAVTDGTITWLKSAITVSLFCIAAAAVYGLSWYLSIVFYKKREI